MKIPYSYKKADSNRYLRQKNPLNSEYIPLSYPAPLLKSYKPGNLSNQDDKFILTSYLSQFAFPVAIHEIDQQSDHQPA